MFGTEQVYDRSWTYVPLVCVFAFCTGLYSAQAAADQREVDLCASLIGVKSPNLGCCYASIVGD